MPDNEPEAIYAIIATEITDLEGYKSYQEGYSYADFPFPIEAISVDDTPVIVEGEIKANRFAISKFRSIDEFNAFYYSENYQKALKRRQNASEIKFAILMRAGRHTVINNSGSGSTKIE